jgi:branched-chain amino acid transport system substrate-binding protein
MRTSVTRRSVVGEIGAGILLHGATGAKAAKQYGSGLTDTEIKLGTTSPYSGPASAYGIYGQAQSAYFQMLNEHGGVNGRKINLISLDNAYNPPKALEQTRKLVESDEVFAIAGFLGTAPNSAVKKYLNSKVVPSIFLTSGDGCQHPQIIWFPECPDPQRGRRRLVDISGDRAKNTRPEFSKST